MPEQPCRVPMRNEWRSSLILKTMSSCQSDGIDFPSTAQYEHEVELYCRTSGRSTLGGSVIHLKMVVPHNFLYSLRDPHGLKMD